jgi:hypothetical protein
MKKNRSTPARRFFIPDLVIGVLTGNTDDDLKRFVGIMEKHIAEHRIVPRFMLDTKGQNVEGWKRLLNDAFAKIEQPFKKKPYDFKIQLEIFDSNKE